jgi:predicted metal-dependent hydrolase
MIQGIWKRHMDAVSVLFPAWERAFAKVASHHQPSVSSALAGRIDAFVREEMAHANAHESYNKRHGLLEAQNNEFRKTRLIHKRPQHKIWLGTMVSIEHLAACMGRMYLDRFSGETGKDHALFAWHSREEIGHKDLAIDIWRELGHSDRDLRAIARQNQGYVLGFIAKNVLSGVDWRKPSELMAVADWSWCMFRKVLIPMLAIYLPRFHPNWFHDEVVA